MFTVAIDGSTTRMMFTRVLHSNELAVQKLRLNEEEMLALGSLVYAIAPNFGSDTTPSIIVLISGKEDNVNNFASGHYTVWKEIVGMCIDRVRNLAANCTSLQGFLTFIVVRGGTDFSVGSLLVEHLFVNYGKNSKLRFTMYLSPHVSIAAVEALFSFLKTLKHAFSYVYDDMQVVIVLGANKSSYAHVISVEKAYHQ